MKKQTQQSSRTLILIDRISLAVLLLSLCAVYAINAIRMTGTLTPTLELFDGHASIRFVDVGQGDCTLIQHRGHAVLIDAGPTGFAESTAAYVRLYAPRIDAFFLTHPHEDHMGGAEAVLRACRVKTLYLSDAAGEGDFYENTLRAAEERGCTVVRVREGAEYLFGDIRLTLLDTFSYPYEGLNDASLALLAEVDGLSLFIAGDAEGGEEAHLAGLPNELHAEIMQVNHHGSSTSSTDALLDRVSPAVAVISCGKSNPHGHPSQTVLERFAKRGIVVRRIDREGTIILRAG